MHLLGLNIPSVILDLFMGKMDCSPSDDKDTWLWMVLVGDTWELQGKMVAEVRSSFPGDIAHPPRNPAEKMNSGYRTEEFCNYVYGLLPALLYTVLPRGYWRSFCKLVRGARIILQRRISHEEIKIAHKCLVEFVSEFELKYIQRKSSRLHFARPCIHNLIHLAPETERLGPLGLLSQFTMERMIGSLTAEICQPANPYANLSQRAASRARVNTFLARMGVTPDSGPPGKRPRDAGRGYFFLHPHDTDSTLLELSEVLALKKYYPNVTGEPRVFKTTRICLPNGQIAHSFHRENKRVGPVRQGRMVKIIQNGVAMYGEVIYYFKYQFLDKCMYPPTDDVIHFLAMVSLCSPPDEEILRLSHTVLWKTHFIHGKRLTVVPISDIKSVVALIPFPKSPTQIAESDDKTQLFEPEYYFVAEELGLDVCSLSCSINLYEDDTEE
ncbi:hypothetical protein FA15DRAFT_679681 [Coprinopsis marcescibilis]|uniref:DUF4218 domain-containing protein n=1 Tax=Coprinopsis marcescibilis TaxID=230819 RepID=A0A5C3L011_COPMA|nr:hypothetical protein FA15DRAFT_679681 [Coprinopsis marcescibilis]